MEANRKGIQLVEARWTGKEIETRIAWMLEVPAEQSSEELLNKVIQGLKGRPEGKWIDESDEGYVECPFCRCATNCDGNIEELHFCWNCGAKLEAEKKEENNEQGENQ